MAREIARAAPETITVGIDLRDKYIDHARMRATAEGLQNLTFQTGDVRKLPFPEGTFDIVWTKYLLQWVAEPMLAMREFARVLKPDGLLVSANFDGFAVTHEPPDPAIQPMTEFVFSNLVDPFIGRKMAGMCRDCHLIDTTEYQSLRKRYWGQHLWSRGYWVATSGNVTDEIWKKYIEDQKPEEPDDNFKVV